LDYKFLFIFIISLSRNYMLENVRGIFLGIVQSFFIVNITFFQYNFHLIVRTYFNVKLFFLDLEKIYMERVFYLSITLIIPKVLWRSLIYNCIVRMVIVYYDL